MAQEYQEYQEYLDRLQCSAQDILNDLKPSSIFHRLGPNRQVSSGQILVLKVHHCLQYEGKFSNDDIKELSNGLITKCETAIAEAEKMPPYYGCISSDLGDDYAEMYPKQELSAKQQKECCADERCAEDPETSLRIILCPDLKFHQFETLLCAFAIFDFKRLPGADY